MNRQTVAFAADLARASVPLALIVAVWCALVWDSPSWTAVALLGVIASAIAETRPTPDTSPGSVLGISSPDVGDPFPASGGLPPTQ